MSMERAKFKERMKALKAYKDETGKGYWDWRDRVSDNLRNSDDNQYVAETDAIQVNTPFVEEKIKYIAPKPQPTNAVITSDDRSEWKKQQDREKGQRLAKAQKDAENEEKALRAVVTLGLLASPSTYFGPLFKAGDENYTDALFSGEGTGNVLGNVALDVAAFGAASAIERNIAKRAAIKNAFEITNPNAALSTPTPKTITKVGDVEVNVPGLAYRQGDEKMAKDFLRTGVVNSDGNFKNPMFAQGKLWYGVPTEDVLHKPASVVTGGLKLSKRNEVVPKTHLIVSNAKMESADQHSLIRPIRVGKNRLGPINDKEMSRWEALGLKGEALRYNDMYYEGVLDHGLTTTVLGEPVRRVPATSGAATSKNSLLYEFKPGYGYRTVEPQPSTSLAFFERQQSKLTEAEIAGIPRGQRNQPTKPNRYIRNDANNSLYIGAAKDNRGLPYSAEDIANADEFVANNMQQSNKNALRSFNDQYNQNFDRAMGDTQKLDEFNSLLSDYLKELPEADDMFLNSNGLQSAYVQDYRKYLHNLGYDAEAVSDANLAKLITQQYKDLTSSMTGKAKGMVVWHGSDTMFDTFDFSNVGRNTGNMGYGGPGNYFANSRSLYGYKQDLNGVLNMQPYLINDISSTPSFSIMQEKNLLPHYVSPNECSLTPDVYKKKIIDLLKETPVKDNKLYIDDISVFPRGTLTPPNGTLSEYMIRRNTGIKSLYPHPSLFIKDEHGAVKLLRDWSDPRVNFKNGGVVPAYGDGTGGNDDPRELVINRANNVYSNYSSAKDFDLGILEYGARKLSKQLFGRGGISNCTLSATGWVDPQNQYMSARNIIDNPDSGYIEIDKEYALPGDLLISKNPEKDSYHTMLIEGFENDEPLLRYSRGGHDTKKNLVKGRTLSRYHELDNAQGGNHTEDRYFRYKFPGEVWLPEIVITAPRKNIYK